MPAVVRTCPALCQRERVVATQSLERATPWSFRGHSMCGHGDLALNAKHKLNPRAYNGLVAPNSGLPWAEHLGVRSLLGSDNRK